MLSAVSLTLQIVHILFGFSIVFSEYCEKLELKPELKTWAVKVNVLSEIIVAVTKAMKYFNATTC